ncbi:MAG: AAA family ATPase [Syntrophobacteraceae bacterium]
MPKLFSFAGLPGAGKTTIAQLLSREIGAVYLRVDEIDAAIWRIDPHRDIGAESYHIAAALAASNLGLGHDAIIDCVNPWACTREIFAAAASGTGMGLLGIEVHCSDQLKRRQRLEGKQPKVPGLKQVDWLKALSRDYSPWLEADVRIDTARQSPEDAIQLILATMAGITDASPAPSGEG